LAVFGNKYNENLSKIYRQLCFYVGFGALNLSPINASTPAAPRENDDYAKELILLCENNIPHNFIGLKIPYYPINRKLVRKIELLDSIKTGKGIICLVIGCLGILICLIVFGNYEIVKFLVASLGS